MEENIEENITELGEPSFAITPISQAISGAEMLKSWESAGCFEVWADQYKDIGPEKKYADSTEYVQAMRSREDYRSH